MTHTASCGNATTRTCAVAVSFWEAFRLPAFPPGDVTLWPSITGGEIIDLLGRMRGSVNAERKKALAERFDRDTSKRARAYSKGNR